MIVSNDNAVCVCIGWLVGTVLPLALSSVAVGRTVIIVIIASVEQARTVLRSVAQIVCSVEQIVIVIVIVISASTTIKVSKPIRADCEDVTPI